MPSISTRIKDLLGFGPKKSDGAFEGESESVAAMPPRLAELARRLKGVGYHVKLTEDGNSFYLDVKARVDSDKCHRFACHGGDISEAIADNAMNLLREKV